MTEEKIDIGKLEGIEKVNLCREIVKGHSYKKVKFQFKGKWKIQTLDVVTANAVLTVYDALSDINKEKFLSKHFLVMIDISWKLLSK